MGNIPTGLLKALLFCPGALVSLVIWCAVVALVPPALSSPLALMSPALLGVLAMRRCEGPVVMVLAGARRATAEEQRTMAAVAEGLQRLGLGERRLLVYRRHRVLDPVVESLGRSTLVLPRSLVDGIARGHLCRNEVVALLAQAIAAHRMRRPRAEIATIASMTPWRMVGRLSRGVGAAFAWMPLASTAWTVRGLIGLVCVVQSALNGHTAAGLLGGGVIVLTYLVPWAGSALDARAESAGDRYVVDRGLGMQLLGLLGRSGTPVSSERLRRLQAPPPPAAGSSCPFQASMSSFSLN